MKLKSDISISGFLEAVKLCRDEVSFDTEAGDHLNLKSALSEFVFIVAIGSDPEKFPGTITCSDEDLQRLKPYLEG